MDGATLIKVEGNDLEGKIKDDASSGSISSSSVLDSAHTSSHEPNSRIPLKLETVNSEVVKMKTEQPFPSQEPLQRINKKSIFEQESSRVEEDGLSYYCSELCNSAGKGIKLYASEKSLQIHMNKDHPSTPPFKCKVCLKVCKSSSDFQIHSRSHLKPTLPFKCEECFLAFRDKCSLNLHLVRKHDYSSEKLNVKVFHCDMCSKRYYKKWALERHVVSVHVVDKAFECHVCSSTFIEQEELLKHIKCHDTPPANVCDVCSKAYKTKNNLLCHLGVHHHHFFHCDKCSKSFSDKSEFDVHSELELKVEYPCQICNEICPSQCSLTLHIQEIHNSTAELQTQEDKIKTSAEEFKCELCFKKFDRKSYIVAHRRQAHSHSQWPCSKCWKTFKTHCDMKTHELNHEGIKPHQCKSCDKSFSGLMKLKVHENNTHSNTKHYKCQLCPQSFGASLSLKLHMAKYHGGNKPFKCHLCTTSCVTQGHLKTHLMSHRTKRLFPCEICSKSLKTRYSLKTHVTKVHAPNPEKVRRHGESLVFVCNLCPFETKEDKHVAAHYNTHGFPKITLLRESLSSGAGKLDLPQTVKFDGKMKCVRCMEKRYKCSICSKYFASLWSFRVHCKVHLNENPYPNICSRRLVVKLI